MSDDILERLRAVWEHEILTAYGQQTIIGAQAEINRLQQELKAEREAHAQTRIERDNWKRIDNKREPEFQRAIEKRNEVLVRLRAAEALVREADEWSDPEISRGPAIPRWVAFKARLAAWLEASHA